MPNSQDLRLHSCRVEFSVNPGYWLSFSEAWTKSLGLDIIQSAATRSDR